MGRDRYAGNLLSLVGILDIECRNWTQFVRGALWTRRSGTRIYCDEDALIDAVLRVEGDLWAHAGGTYDLLWLIEHIRRRGLSATIIEQGSRVICVRVGKLRARDSYALIPLSLARAAPMFGAHKQELRLECGCGRHCGGYCAIRRNLPPAKMRLLEEYLATDIEATRTMIEGALEWLRTHGAHPRATIGATAWAWAREYSDLPRASPRYAAVLRRAYYGGRAEVYRITAPRIWRYDMRSAYPAALVQAALPVGDPKPVIDAAAHRAYSRREPGIYRAIVAAPETNSPPLPLRGRIRIWYPHGKYRGWWTRDELIHAERCGAVVRPDAGLVYEGEERLLAPWCGMIWGLRAADSARAPWIKLIANSLTGKFAQRPEVRITRLLARGDEPRRGEELIGPPSLGLCSRAVTRDHTCAHVVWAATLTAVTRIELGAQLRHAGEEAVYCDTDAVYATRPLSRRLGDDLGMWGYEGQGTDWQALAPKLYRYHHDTNARIRAKGMPHLDARGFDLLSRGESWLAESGVRTLRTAAMSGELWGRRRLERRLRDADPWIGGRLICDDGIRTRPPSIAEVRDIAR